MTTKTVAFTDAEIGYLFQLASIEADLQEESQHIPGGTDEHYAETALRKLYDAMNARTEPADSLQLALGALNADGCIDAKRCVYAVPGLTEYEAARLSGREGWEAALNHVARRCREALAKVGAA